MTTSSSGLVVSGLSKRYGATRALSDVSLEIRPGQVVALIGHNGAGKSTLLRALAGAEVPDKGTISIDGRTMHFQSPINAADAGIACVYQELSLVNELTIAENLFLGTEKVRHLLLDRRAMNRARRRIARGIPHSGLGHGPRRAPAGVAAPAPRGRARHQSQHQVSPSRRADDRARAREQVDELLEVIRRLVKERGIGVLFINHKLNEVYAIADHIVGLANGEIVLSGDARTVTAEQVVEAIVGAGEGPHMARARTPRKDPPPDAKSPRPRSRSRCGDCAGNGLNGIDLTVHAGEILGVYGLNGSGRSRFLRTVYGIEPVVEGEMNLDGAPYRPRHPERAIERGVAFVSEERKSDGFIPQMTSVENVLLPVLERFTQIGILSWRQLRSAARKALGRVPIVGDIEEPITSLSGGNQQKVLFARAILQGPDLLLLDEPTKGVDIGAKAEIHDIIRAFAEEGRSVIVVSSEEEELLEVSDRIVIFRHGSCDGRAAAVGDLSVTDLRRQAWASAE
jgi:ABC-type sugar transport system ATPase subunit